MQRGILSRESLEALRDLTALLSVAWDVPTQRLIDGLLSGGFQEDLIACLDEVKAPAGVRKAGHCCADSLEEFYGRLSSSPHQLLEELLTDYTVMFDVPDNVDTWPLESQHRDRTPGSKGVPLFISTSAVKVKELFNQAQVSLPENEPPDHVAREFDFLAYCLDQELNEHSDTERWMSFRHRIGTEHIATWVSVWAAEVEENASTCFYRALASFTRHLVDSGVLWAGTKSSLVGRHLPLFSR